ncbi:MAG: DUF4838 domain-containing protein, partial [Armatimonadetes bacterium]|nr:DUF4838 domain-containing protein [Armatimonadota bacterium]
MMRLLPLLALLTAVPASALTLARDGAPAAVVVVATDATPAELQAARELADYLGRIAGCEFVVVDEGDAPAGAAVQVGPTSFAAAHGVDTSALGAEEWLVRTVDDALILAGGRPRGTLYAVSHFLEDVLGVHWWSPWAESLPERANIEVGDLDLHGKPAFRYRDIYLTYARDDGRFAAFSRLNRQGDIPITAQYGGSMNYGPPYHVHTFYMYAPPDKYFADHPEWYSLINGERNADRKQLCLTNQELRDFFVAKLRDYIATAWAKADEAGLPRPLVFDISQNDWRGACQCDKCQAIATAQGSEAGPLLDFVNYIADAIKDDYPEVFIDTLAYSYTEQLPKTIRPRDNVIIRLCDTKSNQTRPITYPDNSYFRERLEEWATGAKNLRVWDYAVTYSKPRGLPMPSVQNYQPDYRFYLAHNVRGVFTELEFPVLADMRDMKVWMMCKLLEDPYQDYEQLLDTFMNGFYGAAGPLVKQYLHALEAASEIRPAHMAVSASLSAYSYLDVDFCIRAQAIFDQAEAAVADDATLLQRVRHARLPIDRATAYSFRRLTSEWIAAGHKPEQMPLDRDAITARARQTWLAEIQRRLPRSRWDKAIADMDAELVKYTALPAFVPLPERFADMPKGSVFDFTADVARNWKDIVKTVRDDEAESGITNRLQFPTAIDTERHPVEKYRLPMPWGVYDTRARKTVIGGNIRPEDVPGPGYHWYKLGTCAVGSADYV